MKSYLLKIRGGVEVDSMGKKAGKGALIQEEVSATLGTAQDQYLFQPVMIENHPNDSRVDIDDSGTCQTLTQRMGTGGATCHSSCVPKSDEQKARMTLKHGKRVR